MPATKSATTPARSASPPLCSAEARQDGGQEVLVLRCTRTGTRYQVFDPGLSDEELESVQDDVFRAMGWDHAALIS